MLAWTTIIQAGKIVAKYLLKVKDRKIESKLLFLISFDRFLYTKIYP